MQRSKFPVRKEKSREISWIDDGQLSSPGGPGLAARPNIQHARGPHRPTRGPSCNLTWYSNAEQGGTSHLIRAARRFPCCICAQQLRLSPQTQETTRLRRRKSHARSQLWNNEGWQIRNIDPTISRNRSFLFVCLFVFIETFTTLKFYRGNLLLGFFFQWKGILNLF